MSLQSEPRKEPLPQKSHTASRWLGSVMALFFVAFAAWIFTTGEFVGRTKQGTQIYLQGQPAYMMAIFFLGMAMFPAALAAGSLRYAKVLLTLGGSIIIAVLIYILF